MNVVYPVPSSELFCFSFFFFVLPMQVSPEKMYCFIRLNDGELQHYYFDNLTQVFQFCHVTGATRNLLKNALGFFAFTVKFTL